MYIYGIVIPNKYEDIIQPLIASINKMTPPPLPEIVIVADNHDRDYGGTRVPYTDPHFIFAKAANLGIRYLHDRDVILVNDDIQLMNMNFFDRLRELAYQDPKIGILSPLIRGCVGNAWQRFHEQQNLWHQSLWTKEISGEDPLCFPCVYLKREMLTQIGLLSERFVGYGGEDVEMCYRARAHGWKTSVTRWLVVQHGDGGKELGDGHGKTWSLSYARRFKK